MATTDKIIILVSVPITFIFLIAIAGQYYALIYTKGINQEMQEQLFNSQINFSTKFTTLVSHQLNREAQKIPILSNLLNRYVSKIFAGKVKAQQEHRNSLVNMEMLYKQKEDPFLLKEYKKNNLWVNSWYHKNHTQISTMDQQAQQTLNNIYKFNVLQKTIAYENFNNVSSNKRKLLLNDMLYVMEYQGVFITSGKNATFTKYPKCFGGGLFPYDPRCRPWYINTANKDSLQMYPPDIVISRNFSFIVQLSCSKVSYYNFTEKAIDPLAVLCISISLSQFQDYFSNFANSTKQLYLIEPKSQTILFQSNFYQGMTSLFNLSFVEMKYLQTKEDAQNLNNTINEYFTKFNYMKLNSTDKFRQGEIEAYSKQISYNRNGTKTLAILSPVMIYEKFPTFEGVEVPLSRQKYNVDIPYLQINIISDEDLKQWASQLEQFFSRYFLIVNIILGFVGLFSILITLIFSFGIRNMINASVMHLTQILKKMSDLDLSKDLIEQEMDHEFLSKETHQLYQSFQGIYQILLYTSESFFESNETETLLRLNRNVEFFKQFGNIQAVGITYNNIGSILLSQGHFFQALEQFNSSVIYAIYEIEDFCKKNPLSFSSFLMKDLCFNKYHIESHQELKDKEVSLSRKSSFFQHKSPKRSTQKSRGQSSSSNQIANLGSLITNFESKNLSNQDKFIQALIKNNAIDDTTNLKQFYEENIEQRIQLIQNLFYRKRNYIITLLAFQESIDLEINQCKQQELKKLYNFWKEIKQLLKDLLQISKQFPNSDFHEIEINSLLQKCQFQLENKEKSDNLINQTQNLMNSITQQKSQKLKFSKFQDDLRQKRESNFIELCKSCLVSNSCNNSQIIDQKMLDSLNLTNMRSNENKLDDISTAKISYNSAKKRPESFLESKKKQISNQNSNLQLSATMNESSNCMFQDKNFFQKKRETRMDRSNKFLFESMRKSTHKSTVVTKSKPLSQQKNIEVLFEYKRKLETAIKDNSQLQNFYSLDNLDLIYSFTKAECLIQCNQLRKAATILTYILENKKQIISHYPFKIASLLKQIFDKQNIISEEFNQFFHKFNRNIQMQVAMVFDCSRNDKVMFKSIQLASDIVSSVLENNNDKFGIILVDQKDNFIQEFMFFTSIQQVKDIMSRIIENIMNIISGNENNLFVSFISQLCEEIQNQDMSYKMNESGNYQNQFSFNQIDQDSPTEVKANKTFNLQNKEISEKEESNNEENFSSQNLKQQNEINIYNFYYQNNNKQISQFAKKLQKINSQKQLQELKGDEVSVLSRFEFIDSQELKEIKAIDSENPEQIKKQYFFHMSLHKTLSHLFKNQIKYKNLIEKLIKSGKKDLNIQNNILQQRYIVYSTEEICLNKNELFFKLCQILWALNIKIIMLVENKGNSFLEQLPDQTYYYNSIDIFRVFYNDQQILNFLKTNRNKFCNSSYPTIIQHY